MPSEKLAVKEQLERQFLDHIRDDFPETGPEADIKLWMRDNEDLEQAETVWELRVVMSKYERFTDENQKLVNEAYTQFLESLLASSVLKDS